MTQLFVMPSIGESQRPCTISERLKLRKSVETPTSERSRRFMPLRIFLRALRATDTVSTLSILRMCSKSETVIP